MNLSDIQYSIIEHLRLIPGIQDVLWKYNGLTLSNQAQPFFVVENISEGGTAAAAGRDTFEEVYHFQIGVYAGSQIEVNRKAQEAKDHLRKQIQLFDTSQQPPPTVGFFYADPGQIVPMTTEDPTDETNKHRSYIDVDVTIFIQGGTFEQ